MKPPTRLVAGAVAVVVVAVTVGVLLLTRGQSPGEGRPNIVLILTDDQRWDTLWAMPEVRRLLVADGATFTDSFVVNPLCCPSRSSILTGDYSHTTGVYSNGGPNGGFPAFHDRSTIATWLDDAGYDTGLVGKYLNQYPGHYVPPGWDTWNAMVMNAVVGSYYYDWSLSQGHRLIHYGNRPEDYSTNVLASRAERFIRSADGPLFLYFAPWAPHGAPVPAPGDEHAFARLKPFRPPSYDEADVSDKPAYIRAVPTLGRQQMRFIDAYRRGQYRALLAVDRAVGGIVDALRDTGRLDDTMIVFASDNGLAWGEHRWQRKQVPYEESIRVPLVIRYPPLTSDAVTVSQPALNIDLAPTFAAVAGVPTPHVDGRSLVPLLRGTATPWRHDFLIEHERVAQSFPVPSYCAVRTAHQLFVEYATGESEYYDLRTDPYELRNRADDPHTLGARTVLARRLHELCNPPPPRMTRP
ncbi:MAG: sulfatase [Actinomycetota bacterium]